MIQYFVTTVDISVMVNHHCLQNMDIVIGKTFQLHSKSIQRGASTRIVCRSVVTGPFVKNRGMFSNCLTRGQVNDATVERNKAHILTVLDLALFCARQELPLRGSDESHDSTNKGNFLEVLELLKKYSPEVKRRFDALPANAKMIIIQSKMIYLKLRRRLSWTR